MVINEKSLRVILMNGLLDNNLFHEELGRASSEMLMLLRKLFKQERIWFIMKKQNKEIEEIKRKIVPLLKKNKIVRAGIFGSYARGEQKKNSDIDILIKVPKGIGLEFIGIKFDLENKLGKRIDLISYNGIHPLLKNKILNEEIRIIWKEM